MDNNRKKEALESSETLGTVLHAIVHSQYGDQAYDWDPLTVELELRDDFKSEISVESMNRWSAIQTALASDAFFERVDGFMGICNALASGSPFFSVFDPVTVEEAAWGIAEISLNRDMLEFSRPIRVYLKQILKADGYRGADEYPAPFAMVFDKGVGSKEVRKELRSLDNNDNVEAYVDDQLKAMSAQFSKIDGMKYLDNLLLTKDLDKVVTDFTGGPK